MTRDLARWALTPLLIHAISCLACGGLLPEGLGGAGGEGEETIDETGYENGSEQGTCDGWKEAYCAFKKECDGSDELCKIDVGYLRCHPDAPVSDCQAQIEERIEDKDCHALPAECTPEGLADRTIPIQLCEAYHEAACEKDFYCSINSDIEACVAQWARSEPCGAAYAAWPGADICADSIRDLSCGDALPVECIEVFRFED